MKMISGAIVVSLFLAMSPVTTSVSTDLGPLEKVMDLLHDLKMKIVNEEKDAYIAYHEYNVLCANEHKAISWLIDTEKGLIGELGIEIDSEIAAISEMVQRIQYLVSSIHKAHLALKAATMERNAEAEHYKEEIAKLSEDIRMLRAAIEVLGGNKGAALLQLSSTATVAQALEALVKAEAIGSADAAQLEAFVQMTQQGRHNATGSKSMLSGHPCVDDETCGGPGSDFFCATECMDGVGCQEDMKGNPGFCQECKNCITSEDAVVGNCGQCEEYFKENKVYVNPPSEDILQLLTDTLDKAEDYREQSMKDEQESQFAYNKSETIQSITIKQCEAELNGIRGDQTEAEMAKAIAEGDYHKTREKLTADEKAVKLSDQQCKDNAEAFTRESKLREEEIVVILKAINTLEEKTGVKNPEEMKAKEDTLPFCEESLVREAIAMTSTSCQQKLTSAYEAIQPTEPWEESVQAIHGTKQYCECLGEVPEEEAVKFQCKINTNFVPQAMHQIWLACRENAVPANWGLLQANSTPSNSLPASDTPAKVEGCAGSQWGCCDDAQTTKSDEAGTNCGATQGRQVAAMMSAIQDISFIQTKTHSDSDQGALALESYFQAVRYIEGLGKKLNSKSLTQLSMRMASVARSSNSGIYGGGDPFRVVKDLITDMIAKLEAANEGEEGEHKYCTEQMAATKEDINDKQEAVHKAQSKYEEALAAYKHLKRSITEISHSLVLSMDQSKKETELRDKEIDLYKKEREDMMKAQVGLSEAIKLLRDYYGNPDSGTSNTDASNTIINLLEVVLTDVTKTLATIEADEAQAKKDFEVNEQQYKMDEMEYSGDQENKKKQIIGMEAKVNELKAEMEAAQALLDNAYKEWDALKKRCTFAKDQHAERLAKMEAELEGLKEGLRILKSKGSANLGTGAPVFMQTGSIRSLRGVARRAL